MPKDWFELVIIVVILAAIFFVHRRGQQNPESTGSLGKKLSALKTQVGALETRLGSVDSRVTDIDRRAAKVEDIDGLKSDIAAQGTTIAEVKECIARLDSQGDMRGETLAAVQASADHTKRMVDRLYDVLVTRGLSGGNS